MIFSTLFLQKPRRVLFVNGLFAHTQRVRNLSPGPSLASGTVDMKSLKALEKSPQGGDCAEPDGGISGY